MICSFRAVGDDDCEGEGGGSGQECKATRIVARRLIVTRAREPKTPNTADKIRVLVLRLSYVVLEPQGGNLFGNFAPLAGL